MPTLLSELEPLVERVVKEFLRRYAAPPRYDRAEWRAECYGEAWRCLVCALRTYKPERGALHGYLYRALHNHLSDFRKREWRWQCQGCVSLDAPIEHEDGETPSWEWTHPDSVELETTLCEQVAVKQALAALPAVDRQLVQWVWIEGLSHADAAVQLGVSRQAVTKRLARVRAWLQQQLCNLGENG